MPQLGMESMLVVNREVHSTAPAESFGGKERGDAG